MISCYHSDKIFLFYLYFYANALPLPLVVCCIEQLVWLHLQISEDILEVCSMKQQCKDTYINKMKLRDALYDVIKRIFPC